MNLSYIWIVLTLTTVCAVGYGQGDQLFTIVTEAQCGVHFNNKLQDTKEDNIMIYSNFYGGAGVGIGDINNDGLEDLFFAGNQVADQLYLNKGNLQFENITQSAGIIDNGGWSSGVLLADVNQDGWIDIYVTRELYDHKPDLRRNKLYINNTDNTFTESANEYGVDNSERTRHATFLDYDNDGDLDLFILNQPPNPGDYSSFYNTELLLDDYRPILYAYESGKFVDVSLAAGFNKTGFPNSVVASDLNGDGWTDLFVANDFYAGDWYYINNGDGSFTDRALDFLPHTSFSSMGVDAADINNDGRLDVGVVDMVAEDNYRQKANMSGMNPKAFWKVVDDGGGHQYMYNMLHYNNGEGCFSDIAQLAGIASTDWSWSILMADLDNDGWKDIHITNGLMRDIRNKDASKELPKYLEAELYKYIQANPNPDEIGIWDIVDINKALSLVPSVKLKNFAFKNNGDLTFSKVTDDWGFTQKTFSNGSAYADLDNDGDLDIVVNNINDVASIYQNNTDKKLNGNYIRIVANADSDNMLPEGTKVWITTSEGQQYSEINTTRGMYSTSERVAHFGVGSAAIIDKIKVQWRDGKISQLLDVMANQEIIVKYSEANASEEAEERTSEPIFQDVTDEMSVRHIHHENDFDDYTFQVLLPHKMSTHGPCISTGDVNGDGLEDFYVGGAVGHTGSMYLQSRDGQFYPVAEDTFARDSASEDVGSLLFDADGDGDLDLYVVSGGNERLAASQWYQDRLYINDGTGKFAKNKDALPTMKISGSKVVASDVDHDGDLDLFVAGRHTVWSYPEPATSVLLINEGGIFKDATITKAPELIDLGMVNDAQWSDYNNDGWDDLILVGEWMAITILENKDGQLRRIKSKSLDQSLGWWFAVDVSDVDGDGDQDIIAGNLGKNYKYKATSEEPFEVYYYDFDNNNSKDIVLTYYNFGIQYPLRGKQCSSEQVPALNDKFATYNIFASSDVAEIYEEDKLASALHYEATTFATTYFENHGDGKFEAKELPIESQFSSVNDMIISDFNSDGHQDILLAGNLYNAEVETARNDAGYGFFLEGNGRGDFKPIDRKESGVFLPYNVKSLATIDNGKFILVGINDGTMRILKY